MTNELIALADRIVHEPAECWAGCRDAACPYSHLDTWRAPDGVSHFTRRDAEEWLARALTQDLKS